MSIVYWKQGVSIIRRKVLEGEKRALSATRDFGTLYYEDRRPLYCTTESHRTVSSGRLLGSTESRSEWSLLGDSDARAEEEGGGVRSGPGAARTILLFIPLVLGPLNSLVWYVPSLRYTRGWRMHCGAEVTESSTNKQHHLSRERERFIRNNSP